MERKIGNSGHLGIGTKNPTMKFDVKSVWESAMPKLSGIEGQPVIVTSTPDETVLSYRDVICKWNWKPIKVTLNWDDLPSQGVFYEQAIGRGVRKSKRIFSDIDPYGEENWDEK